MSLQDELIRVKEALQLANKQNARLMTTNSRLQLDFTDFTRLDRIRGQLQLKTEECEALQKIHTRDTQKIEWLKRDPDERSEELQEKLEDIEVELKVLEQEMEIRKPLVMIGIAIRKWFLAQAKGNVYKSSVNESDIVWVQAGNAAANEANGAADAALFTSAMVDDGWAFCGTAWSEVFEELYGVEPRDCQKLLPVVRRMKDCQATLRTHKSLRGGAGPIDLRGDVEGYLRILKEHFAGGITIAKSLEVKHIVENLETAMEKLVDTIL